MKAMKVETTMERTKRWLYWVDIALIFSGLAAVVLLMLTYLWHLITPLAYLSLHQLQEIRHILLSAVLTGILSSRFRKLQKS